MEELDKRLDKIWHQIQVLPYSNNRTDLLILWHMANEVKRNLSQESVICRQRKRETIKYRELRQKLEESVLAVEQNYTFVILLGD